MLKSEDALAPLLNRVSVPVLLLSGILLPMTLAPTWLRRLARLNPFSHVVDGARAAFRNDLGDSSLMIGDRDPNVPARVRVTRTSA